MRSQALVSWFAMLSLALYLKAQALASKNMALCVRVPAPRQVFNQISCPDCSKLSQALLAPV